MELLQSADQAREKMTKGGLFQAADFSKPWASSDAIFIVNEQRFYVHRWLLSWCSPVFDKMFSSDFLEKTKTEIPLPGKKPAEFQELMLMVYSLAERPAITIENCFYLLKLADEYQMDFLLEKCVDFLVAASGSICAGRLSIHEFFNDFLPASSQLEKAHVLSLIILAQEYKLDRLLATCVSQARYFSLRELKEDYVELCELLEPMNYCRILEEIIDRMEGRFCVF